MIFHYICNRCVADQAGKPVEQLSVREYKDHCARLAVTIDHPAGQRISEKCSIHGDNLTQCNGLEIAYVRGYGYLDKKAVKNDINLHTMVTGADPYAEHRKDGDSNELIRKLRRNKRYQPKTTDVFMR